MKKAKNSLDIHHSKPHFIEADKQDNLPKVKSEKNVILETENYNIYEDEVISSKQSSEQSSFQLDNQNEKQIKQNRENIDKLLSRLGLHNRQQNKKKNQELEIVVNNFVQNCIGLVNKQQNTDEYQNIYDAQFKQKKTKKQERKSIFVTELTDMQKVNKIDPSGIKIIYKFIRIFMKNISLGCEIIVQHSIFQAFILLVILGNSIKMATDDPLSEDHSLPALQNFFTGIYTTEMVLKIFAYGLIFNKKAYLRDLWNILDFIIVCTSLLPLIISLGFSVSALRAIRVLRPLRTITKIRALKMIVRTLFYSFSLVMDSLYILFFVMLVFAIAGMQLFGGNLKLKCMNLSTGSFSNNTCQSDSDCSNDFICAKSISSPNFSIQNFDTFLWSYLSVFQTITLEGWSIIMVSIQKSTGFAYCLYSLMIVFFCEYVLLNMTMAILKYKYSQVKGNNIEEEQEEKQEYEIDMLKKIGIYKDITLIPETTPLLRIKDQAKIFTGSETSFEEAIQSNYFNESEISLLTYLRTPKISEKLLNGNKTKNKIDLGELKKLGKVNEVKWDVKNLQFETNQIEQDRKDDKQQKMLSEKSIQQNNKNNENEMQNQEISQESFFQSQEQQENTLKDIQESALEQKVIEVQKKLNHSQKSINYLQMQMQAPQKKIMKLTEVEKPKIKRQISELDKLLQLIGMRTVQKHKPERFKINIPDIDPSNLEVQRLYERFQDLGDFSIKRVRKANQLEQIEINHKKINRKKQIKKAALPVQEVIEDNCLDIKQLHLKNQLQKKQLRCRLKPNKVIDQFRTYQYTRVLASEKIKIAQKKKEQIKQNINLLAFHVKYHTNHEQNMQKNGKNSLFIRNLQSQKSMLKIPQMINLKQNSQNNRQSTLKISNGNQKSSNEYLKMLQNHQMGQKIEMNLDRINAVFFKKEKAKEKLKEADAQEQYLKIRQDDILKKHGYIDLQCPIAPTERRSYFIEAMNMKNQEYQIYVKGFMGFITVFRKKTLLFISMPLYDNFMLSIVLCNTLIMALDGFVITDNQPYSTINVTFTYIFVFDLLVKLVAYGLNFFGDIMNLFDTLVVVISIVELSLGTSNLSALRSIKILRAFRVLRITRLIRSLNYMKIVMGVVTSVINEFIYIFLLLCLFIFIYTLLGMQILGGTLIAPQISGVRQNFDSFFNALFSVFQIITVQNWNDIQTVCATSSLGPGIIIFLISLIFIGNWILLNLLQAVLLDGFDKDSVNEQQLQEISSQKQQNNQSEYSQKLSNLEKQSSASQQTSNQDIKIQSTDLSLFLLSSDNLFRKICLAITKSAIFEGFMFVIILSSSIKLAFDSYLQPTSSLIDLSSNLDLVFNFIFIAQCIFKIVSYGLVIGQNTYLKNSWNKLDFFIVTASIFDMLLSSVNLSILKLLRTLRPLRIISRNQEIKIIISSLFQSIYGIMNVLIIILCVFLMFGILGINLLQGKLDFCNTSGPNLVPGLYGPYNINQTQCQSINGTWATQMVNFQNIANSMISLYIFSTRENWPYYAYTFIDSSENGPVQDNSQIIYFVYCVIFIFIGSLFFMDLLVGILFMNFHEAEQKIRPKLLTDKQINWQNLQKIIVQENPAFELYLQPQNIVRKFFFKIVTHKFFQFIITLTILGNILGMMIGNDDITDSQASSLLMVNTVCSYIFISQLAFKLIAFKQAYFLSAWNVFDFFVVSASILDIILTTSGAKSNGSSAISILPQIARIFRVLRITRLLRMFKRFKGLQKLIQTFIFSMPALGKGLSILFLYLFIFSILATNLFGNIASDHGGYMNQFLNYNDFHHAFQMLFINMTGENWYFYMFYTLDQNYVTCEAGYDNCTSQYYYIFWLPFMFFGQKVFLQLFVLIVLDQFEANYINENNPLGIFTLFEQDFRDNWIQITAKYHSQKIQSKRLIDLMMILRSPLGLDRTQTLAKYESQLKENDKISSEEIEQKINELDRKIKKNAAKLLHKMNVIKNRIYFGYHETFFNFAKLAIVPQFYDSANQYQKSALDAMHKASEQCLQKLKPAGNLYFYGQDQGGDQNPLNPISLILYTQMIVKSWNNYSNKLKKKKNTDKQKENQDNFESLNNSCASDLSQAKYQKLPNHIKLAMRRGGLIQNKGEVINKTCQFKIIPNIQAHYSDQRRQKHKVSILKSKSIKKNSRGSMQSSSYKGNNKVSMKQAIENLHNQ